MGRPCLSLLLLTGLALTAVRADFKVVAIPDIQYYTAGLNGGTNAMWTAQTSWIQTNRATENIVYVASLGDITDHGNTYASEWVNAKAGFDLLESPVSIPYGTCVGNHDQTPNTGFPLTCSTSSYNAYFGTAHFSGRTYYGSPYQAGNNDSHYDLFTADGVSFIVIYLEYDSHNQDTVNMNTWAYNLLTSFSGRKGIIVSHFIGDGGFPTCPFGPQGQGIYDKLKNRGNVQLMLSGHVGNGWGRRSDPNLVNGRRINTLVSNYQFSGQGGGGYMRIYTFSPTNDTISAVTYSPYLNAYKTDANNQFTIPWQFYRHCSFDGNASTDKSLYNNGTWKIYGASNLSNGVAGDIPVPGDYNGDGITDHAVWRPSTGDWLIPGMATVNYGVPGDIPVPGDYDGDGKTDCAVYRPGTTDSLWYVKLSTTGASTNFMYGVPTDVPTPGDYNGDGKTDYSVFRPGSPNNKWYISGMTAQTYGIPGDMPVPGDYNGDGKTDIAVFRSSNGTWHRNGLTTTYGQTGDIPGPGDFNGDGVTDLSVWRPSTNQWFTLGTTYSFGASGDKPLPLPYAIRRVYFP